MNFQYYDLLSCIVMGYIVLIAGLSFLDIPFNKDWGIPYLAIAYVIGYMVNSLGSMIEGGFYWSIGGMPSENLLTIDETKKYTGIDKVRFYYAKETIAETNAILNTYKANYALAMRAQYLQQYFPKTIAFLSEKLTNA